MTRLTSAAMTLAVAAIFFTVTTAVAAPTYIYGNYGNVATSVFSATLGYVNSVQNNTLASQGFSVGTTPWEITRLDVALANSGTDSPAPKVYLFSDNSGVPGNFLSEFTLSNGPVTNSKTTHFFSGSYQAEASTNYWMVVGDGASQSSQSSFEWYLEDTNATPTERNTSGVTYLGSKVQSFSAGPWSDTFSGLSMKVNAVAVPEPSTFAVAAVVTLLGVGAAARRKLKARR